MKRGLFEITSFVNNGGNVVFSGCHAGTGTFGPQFVEEANRLLDLKLNVYMNNDKSSIANTVEYMLNNTLSIPENNGKTLFKDGFVRNFINGEGKVSQEQTKQSILLKSSGTPIELSQPLPLEHYKNR